MFVKEFEVKDLENYALFQNTLFGFSEDKNYGKYLIENFSLDKNQILFIAYSNELVVGAIFIRIKNFVCNIDRLDVLDDYRNLGIGKELVFVVVNRFSNSINRFDLLVSNCEKDARVFYHKIGFVDNGVKDNAYKMTLEIKKEEVA